MKQCCKCKIVKNRSEFSPARHHLDGLMSHCKQCRNAGNLKKVSTNREVHRARRRAIYASNPERQRNATREYKFGVKSEQYQGMLQKQDGVCAICNRKERDKNNKALAIDHDHINHRVRGLLCRRCNTALGMMDDDLSIVQNAADYLEVDLAVQTV